MSKRESILIGLAFLLASLPLFVAILSVLIPESDTGLAGKDFLAREATPLSYVVVGDSLAEGVGDTTNQDGFIPLLTQSLAGTYGCQATDSSYGVSGGTSK